MKYSENRDKSVRFALSAIAYSFATFLSALVGCMLINLHDVGFLIIFIIAIAAILFISATIEFIGALLRVIVQFTINRSVATWLAFIVFVACTLATVYVFIYYFG